MAQSPPWESLIRFSAPDGRVYWAPLPLSAPLEAGIEVDAYPSIEDLEKKYLGQKATVSKLLSPIPNAGSNPIICIGLNYRNHALEAKLNIPTYPPMWYKPAAALANPEEEILIPRQAFENFLDYEGELVAVTSKPAKNVSETDAASYILGYTLGNDLTARLFQDPNRQAGQYTYAKAFDKFAPIGPRLLHPSLLAPSSNQVKIQTKVNGKTVQSSELDFIFGIEKIISFLSQGVSIPKGSAIMTGTPKGVGWFQEPKYSLRDGDVVEVGLGGLRGGGEVWLRNRVVYEKGDGKGGEVNGDGDTA